MISTGIALMAAQQAQEAACKGVVSIFDSAKASISQMQEYASCVNTLYPENLSSSDIIAIKVAIILAFIGAVGGAWSGYKMGYNTVVDTLLMSFMGAIILPVAVGCILGMFYGMCWVVFS